MRPIVYLPLVLGRSGSGKSIFLRAIADHQNNDIITTGEINLDYQQRQAIGQRGAVYIDFNNFVALGDLTVREYLNYVYATTIGPSNNYNAGIIDIFLQTFDLVEVGNTFINPIFGKSLNINQQIKVAICAELLNPPSILLLDGPLDSLDSYLSYQLMAEIQQVFLELSVKFAVVFTMKQYTERLLDLCGNIFVFGNSSMLYFGPFSSMPRYLNEIGYFNITLDDAVDFLLGISVKEEYRNFPMLFVNSKFGNDLILKKDSLLSSTTVISQNDLEVGHGNPGLNGGGTRMLTININVNSTILISTKTEHPNFNHNIIHFIYQFMELLKIQFKIGCRDITLYHLQCLLVIAFGFFVGAVFFQLKYNIKNIYAVFGSISFLVNMMCFIQVFLFILNTFIIIS